MAIKVLKQGIDFQTAAANDKKIHDTVISILDDIRANGDAAVPQYSEKFDKWSPPS